MSSTLAQVRQRMLQLEPMLGRVESIASLTATTVVVTALKTGTVQPQRYSNVWLCRPGAALSGGAAVDRVRFASAFDSSTGTITHAGVNYADTTATGESVETLEYEPYLLDNAIQKALRGTRFLDNTIIPRNVAGLYWLDSTRFPWVTGAENLNICWNGNPVLTDNRHFEKWNVVSTAGAIQPDSWTLAGAAATFSRSSTSRRGAYSLSVTRSGTNATVAQTPGLLETGATLSADALRGFLCTAAVVVKTAVASQVRVQITDGITTSNSSYHTGGNTWEELTATITPASTATTLTVTVSVEVDGTALIDEAYCLFGPINDTVRRDQWRNRYLDPLPKWEMGQPLELNSFIGRGGQLIVESYRPYTEFDQTRINSGLADADTTDAPIEMIAHGAIWQLLKEQVQTKTITEKMIEHRNTYGWLRDQHQATASADRSIRPGLQVFGPATTVSARAR